VAQANVKLLDLALQYDESLFTQATFLGLQDLALVEAVVNRLGESVFLWVRHVATVQTHPLLECSITFVDFVLVRQNLVVFGLDLLEQVSYFSRSVCHWDMSQHFAHTITMLEWEKIVPSCMNCSSTDAASSGMWILMIDASCDQRETLLADYHALEPKRHVIH